MSISQGQFISEYLQRIDYHGSTEPCLETLTQLQRCHTQHTPFENLELLKEGFTPNLKQDFLFDKIVRRRRGGVCYELNTSFYNLLRELGFSCHQISGAVQPGENIFSHVVTLIHLPEGDYIADVGLADAWLPPVQTSGCVSHADGTDYFLTPEAEQLSQVMCRRPGREPRRLYTVALTPREVSDYIGRFRWASAMGNTIFSKYPICALFPPGDQITLRKQILTVMRGGHVTEERPVAPGGETERCLREYFHLF